MARFDYDDKVLDVVKDIPKDEIENEEEVGKDYKWPIKVMIGLFMVLLIISMGVPFYNINTNPKPDKIPTIDEIFPNLVCTNFGE